jgi:hypothetical protein
VGEGQREEPQEEMIQGTGAGAELGRRMRLMASFARVVVIGEL